LILYLLCIGLSSSNCRVEVKVVSNLTVASAEQNSSFVATTVDLAKTQSIKVAVPSVDVSSVWVPKLVNVKATEASAIGPQLLASLIVTTSSK
jgi:vacuolar-type H+-ATPase subunit D/Vma8